MSPEMFQVFVGVFTLWGVAVAIKAINSLRTREPYVFSMWDGGMLRAGKRLNKMGTQIKVVVGALMAAGCFAQLTRLVNLRSGAYFIMFVAMMSLVSDFVTAES